MVREPLSRFRITRLLPFLGSSWGSKSLRRHTASSAILCTACPSTPERTRPTRGISALIQRTSGFSESSRRSLSIELAPRKLLRTDSDSRDTVVTRRPRVLPSCSKRATVGGDGMRIRLWFSETGLAWLCPPCGGNPEGDFASDMGKRA